FFFQAEDGIRDYKVTGVQTCALPISSQFGHSNLFLGGASAEGSCGYRRTGSTPLLCINCMGEPATNTNGHSCSGSRKGQGWGGRSEERRVGKECRWRGETSVAQSRAE